MSGLPFEVGMELTGWDLFWALLETRPCAQECLTALAGEVEGQMRRELSLETVSGNPVISALRKLYRAAGCDPTRYRASSEALLRRLVKGETFPSIHPLVDLNNFLSALTAVPCCVMDESRLAPPFVFRAGRAGESYDSLRGPFNLEGKPLLLDQAGACDTPITGGQRVKVTPDTRRAWLVCYLPAGVIAPGAVQQQLETLLRKCPVASIIHSGNS